MKSKRRYRFILCYAYQRNFPELYNGDRFVHDFRTFSSRRDLDKFLSCLKSQDFIGFITLCYYSVSILSSEFRLSDSLL